MGQSTLQKLHAVKAWLRISFCTCRLLILSLVAAGEASICFSSAAKHAILLTVAHSLLSLSAGSPAPKFDPLKPHTVY